MFKKAVNEAIIKNVMDRMSNGSDPMAQAVSSMTEKLAQEVTKDPGKFIDESGNIRQDISPEHILDGWKDIRKQQLPGYLGTHVADTLADTIKAGGNANFAATSILGAALQNFKPKSAGAFNISNYSPLAAAKTLAGGAAIKTATDAVSDIVHDWTNDFKKMNESSQRDALVLNNPNVKGEGLRYLDNARHINKE